MVAEELGCHIGDFGYTGLAVLHIAVVLRKGGFVHTVLEVHRIEVVRIAVVGSLVVVARMLQKVFRRGSL